jgi:hypothetical protein
VAASSPALGGRRVYGEDAVSPRWSPVPVLIPICPVEKVEKG